MSVVKVDPRSPDLAIIADAGARLRRGELVAFPTETVYGLGANALSGEAVSRIYAAKSRPAWNPVIAHVPHVAAARALARDWPATAECLAQAFWPGPLTLVVPKASHVPDVATAGLDAVAVRVPDHPVALALLEAAGVPCSPIHDFKQVREQPQTQALGIFQDIPEIDLRVVGLPLSFNGVRPPVGHRAPHIGEHSALFGAPIPKSGKHEKDDA